MPLPHLPFSPYLVIRLRDSGLWMWRDYELNCIVPDAPIVQVAAVTVTCSCSRWMLCPKHLVTTDSSRLVAGGAIVAWDTTGQGAIVRWIVDGHGTHPTHYIIRTSNLICHQSTTPTASNKALNRTSRWRPNLQLEKHLLRSSLAVGSQCCAHSPLFPAHNTLSTSFFASHLL